MNKLKLVVQRVKNAEVKVENEVVGKIAKGFLVLLGVTHEDTEQTADYLVTKLCNLRVFEDVEGKMNLSLKDINGELLIVSQFTLYGDCKKGNRPSFIEAMPGSAAKEYYELFNEKLRKYCKVETGIFGADMKVSIENDGPVTILLESR